jgi:anti-sigma factor RsiW
MRMDHLSESDLDDLRRGGVPGARIPEIARHLESCAECAHRAASPAEVVRFARGISAVLALQEGDETVHVDADFDLYLDGALPDDRRREVEQHLAACEVCRRELDDLRAWSATLTASKPRSRALWYAGAAAAAIAFVVFFLLRSPHPPPASPPAAVPRPATIAAPAGPAGYARPEWDALVRTALRTGQVEIADPFSAMRAEDRFRSRPSKPEAPRSSGLSPSATTVDDVRPELRWQVASGESYRLVISLDDDVVVESPVLRSAPWRSSRNLLRGKVYRWQVTVTGKDGAVRILPPPPEPPALFRIATQRDHDEIAAALREHPNDDLLLGLLYARAGIEESARNHLRRYADAARTPVSERLAASTR